MARVTAPCRVFVYFCLPPVPVSLYRVPSSLCHQWTCVLLRHIPSGLLAPFRHIGLVLLCHNLAKVESHLQIASRVLSPLSLTSSLLCLRQHLLHPFFPPIPPHGLCRAVHLPAGGPPSQTGWAPRGFNARTPRASRLGLDLERETNHPFSTSY